MASKQHKDVEYAVEDGSGKERVFKTFDEAAGFAVSLASSGRPDVHIDILVWSKAGARHVMGDEGVERYDEDPEASIFERIEITADAIGSIA